MNKKIRKSIKHKLTMIDRGYTPGILTNKEINILLKLVSKANKNNRAEQAAVTFTKKILEGWPDDFGYIDGFDLQIMLETAGVLQRRTKEEIVKCFHDNEACACREYDNDLKVDEVECFEIIKRLKED